MRQLLCLLALLAAVPAAADPCADADAALHGKRYAEAVLQANACLAGSLTERGRVAMLQVRAQGYEGQKLYDQAVSDQQEAIRLDASRDAWPRIMLGVFRREQKRYDEALAALKEAEARDEDGPGTGPGMAVYYHTGRTLNEMGRFKDAIKAFGKGLKRQPDYAWAYYHRGLSREGLGDKAGARKDFARAAKLAAKGTLEPEMAAKLKEYGLKPR